MRRFPASLTRGARIASAAFIVGMLLVAVAPLVLGALLGDASGWLALVGIPALAIAWVVWALAPRAFLVGNGVIAVERRRWRRLAFPLARLTRVARLPPDRFAGALRVAGSSGVFGSYGLFWSRALGTFRLYATRPDRLVLFDTDRERVVVSPDDPDGFVEAVRAVTLAPLAGDLPARAERPPHGRRRIVVTIAGALGIPAIVVAGIGLASWGYAPRRIHVAGDAIRIERRLGATEIPVAQVRNVEVLEPARFRGTVRTAGYAFGGVAYGRFRAPALGTFRLEQHRPRGPWILVDAERRWVLTPDDPQAFLAALRGP